MDGWPVRGCRTVDLPVAKITATRNCLWNGSSEDVGFGSTLFAGQQLDLAAGLVEVTFIDGAQVVLEGPAKFDVKATDLAELHEGRIAAVVPERARGFRSRHQRAQRRRLGHRVWRVGGGG